MTVQETAKSLALITVCVYIATTILHFGTHLIRAASAQRRLAATFGMAIRYQTMPLVNSEHVLVDVC